MIMSSMSITAERAKVIDFSDKYYETPAALATAKDATFGMTPEDLAGKIIGVRPSSTNEAYATQVLRQELDDQESTRPRTRRTRTSPPAASTPMVGDEMALEGFLDTPTGQGLLQDAGALPYDNETLGTGIGAGFRKSDTTLREEFNQGSSDIRANGTYDKITKKYFNFDIYGG